MLDKKIGFPYSFLNKSKKKGGIPKLKIHIDFKLSIKIPQERIKINNLLYQSRKFIPRLYFGILKAIFSAVEEKAIARLKETSPKRYVRNGRQRNHRQIRTAYGPVRYQMAREESSLSVPDGTKVRLQKSRHTKKVAMRWALASVREKEEGNKSAAKFK